MFYLHKLLTVVIGVHLFYGSSVYSTDGENDVNSRINSDFNRGAAMPVRNQNQQNQDALYPLKQKLQQMAASRDEGQGQQQQMAASRNEGPGQQQQMAANHHVGEGQHVPSINMNKRKRVKVVLQENDNTDTNKKEQYESPLNLEGRNQSMKKKLRKKFKVKRKNNNLKFNEISRNADENNGAALQNNGPVQDFVQVVDTASNHQTKARQPQDLDVNKVKPVIETKAEATNREKDTQNEMQHAQEYDVNKLQRYRVHNQRLNEGQSQNSYQGAGTRVNQETNENGGTGAKPRFNQFSDNSFNQNPPVNNDNGVNQKSYQRGNTGVDRNVNRAIDTGDLYHRDNTGVNQNDNKIKQDSYQRDNTGVNQRDNTGVNQNLNENGNTGVNRDSYQRDNTGTGVNQRDNSGTGVNQRDNTGTGVNERDNTGTGVNGDTGVKRDTYQRDYTGVKKMGETGAGRYDQVNSNFRYGQKKRTFPRGKSRPDVSQREDVVWFEEYHSFSLRASVDNRLRIRYAPIPKEGSPWPLPHFYRPGNTQYLVKPHKFKLHAAGETCDILEFAFERIRKNMFGKIGETEPSGKEETKFHFFRQSDDDLAEIKTLNVTVLKECGKFPQLEMDESYDLEVRKSGAVIIAREIWGAIRGLETFSQLVHQNDKGNFVVNRTLIHDFPRFKHRGILLDTSRHYLNKETIVLNLEAMAQNKMNVFHWHIVDEQSFPFDCHTYPNLTKMGAYSQSHIYTHDDVKEIINEARLRGIRVIPEFDTPGHTFAWGFGTDNLLTPCYNYAGQPDGFFGPVNPILKSTYRFLNGLFAEVLGLFQDKYVHLGGDEVPLECWQTNPFLQRFMSRNKLYDVKELLNVYERKLVDIITALGKSRDVGSGYITWQEVFDDGVQLKPDAIVQIWKGDAWDIDRVTSKGYRALFSTCWYLDYINYGQDWDKYYKCDQIGPHLEMYNVHNESLLIGGDVCLWTEYADDENILPRIWPRASAAAERLWSHKDVQNAEAAAPRIEEHRCRMKRRGIPVGVLSGPGYCKEYNTKTTPIMTWLDWAGIGPIKGKNPGQDHTTKNIYVVDMNAMYLIPLIIVVCLVCMIILSSLQQTPQKKILAILTLPVSGTRRSMKGLFYIFMIFTIIWCIWTAPIWLHSWENNNRQNK